jgi:glycosyltransferase involved in cell wall biosynthesis
MPKNRIAIVVPYRFVPPRNGGHKAAHGLCTFLQHEAEVIAYSTSDNDIAAAPFELKGLLPAKLAKYLDPLRVVKWFRQFRADQIQLCITHQPFIALALFPVCWLLKIPLHIYAQNLEYERFKSMKKKWWPIVFMVEWIGFKLARHIYFISPDEIEPGKKIFGLKASKCSVLPYGTPHQGPPTDEAPIKAAVRARHGFSETEKLIIFFGPQSYQPNLEAVQLIINHINPVLQQEAAFDYRFIICGGGLPAHYQQLSDYPNVTYLGFVDEIEDYVKAADLMINPIISGGGVKTKLIEAIALNKTVVSSKSGALGVNPRACGHKLITVEDHDYPAYARAIIKRLKEEEPPTPASYYEAYYWGAIVKKVNRPGLPPA